MSARFTTNFLTLLLGAGLVVATFAFSHATAGWVTLGVGSAGVARRRAQLRPPPPGRLSAHG